MDKVWWTESEPFYTVSDMISDLLNRDTLREFFDYTDSAIHLSDYKYQAKQWIEREREMLNKIDKELDKLPDSTEEYIDE